MTSKREIVLPALAVAAALSGISSPAFAQAVVQQEGDQLDEIVVTAQRREQSLQDVPVSVTAFDAKEIEARGATSLRDLGMSAPNVTFNTSARGQNVRIRGVGAADTTVNFEPGVGIYIDGVYLPRMNGMNLDLVGIERVEILRGPQGTLFGRNTIGGAINITTTRPGDTLSGTVEATAGNYSRTDLQASVEGPIVPGTLSGRISGVVRKRDGYGVRRSFATGEKLDEGDDANRFGFRGSLDWKPSGDIDVQLSANVFKVDEKNPIYDLVKTFQTSLVNLSNQFTALDYTDQLLTSDGFTNYATGPNIEKLDQWDVSLHANWKLGNLTLKSITSYLDQSHTQGSDIDASPLNIFEQIVIEDTKYFSQEFQLGGVSARERLTWVTGIYYGKEKASMNGASFIFQTLWDALKIDASTDLYIWQDSWNAAAYGQATYKLTDDLSVTAGLRYSHDDKTLSRMRKRLNPPFAIYVPLVEQEDNWSALTGRFGFEYEFNRDVMAYVSASRGYKSGGLNASSTSTAAFQPFDPEFIWNYELGVRSEFLNKRVRLNASVFYSDYTDLQFFIFAQDPTGAPITIVDNAAEVALKGAEVELTAVPTSGLVVGGSVGYLSGKYKAVKPGSPITLDDELADTPKWTVSLFGQYTHPLSAGGNIQARVDYAYKTKQHRFASNSPFGITGAYPWLSARLAFTSADGNWEAAVFGDNLTDEQVTSFIFDVQTVFNVHASYFPPRTYGVSLKYNF